MSLRVLRVELEERRSRSIDAVQSALGTWTDRAGLLVRISSENGLVGLGEASPLPGYSQDTLECARADLDAFAGHVPLTLPLSQTTTTTIREAVRALASSSAAFAVETALLDLAGQSMGVPVFQLLRSYARASSAADLDRTRSSEADRLPLARWITEPPGQAQLHAALTAVQAGYTTLKFKISPASFDAQVSMLRELRTRRPSIGIRLDANRSLRPQQLLDDLTTLAQVEPEFIEEPSTPDALERVGPPPVPVALDESLHGLTFDEARELLTRHCLDLHCRFVVLKPMALGGSLRCLELASIAQELGAAAVVSHLLDGPVALAACAELALALRSRAASGLAPHAGLAAWPTCTLAALAEPWLHPHSHPGLGALFDNAAFAGLKTCGRS